MVSGLQQLIKPGGIGSAFGESIYKVSIFVVSTYEEKKSHLTNIDDTLS